MISFLNKKKSNNNVIEYPHYVIVVRDETFWVVRSVKSNNPNYDYYNSRRVSLF